MNRILISFGSSILFHLILAIIFSFVVFAKNYKEIIEYIEVELLKKEKPKIRKEESIKLPIKKVVKVKGEGVKEIKVEKLKVKEGIFKAPKVGKEEKIRTQEEETLPIRSTTQGNIETIVDTQPFSIKGEEKIEETIAKEYAPYTIVGPLSTRGIIYQPKPELPKYFEEQGILPAKVKLRIYVLPDGSVRNVDILKSSGYGEWDKIVAQTAMRWKFYKLPPEIKRIDWGDVVIKTYLY
jgi:TonB family protein